MTKPIATISRTNEILDRFNLHAKKSYGQNFIIEPKIVEKIAELSLCDDIAVIEIGPGIGALTEQLAKRAKHVVSFEIDKRLEEALNYSLAEYNNIEIVYEDFLECDIKSLVDKYKDMYGNVVIASNLPYYITTPILFKIFESECDVESITVMMQKEVADRFDAKVATKEYNALTIISSAYYDCKTVLKVPKTVFNPKPNVDSAVVRFTKKKEDLKVFDKKSLFELIKACFKQRRKTIYNNYRSYLIDEKKAKLFLEKANISPSARAETLTLEDFIRLKEIQDEG